MSDYIAHMILGDQANNAALEKAVENGARGVVKHVIDSFLTKYFPVLSGVTWIIDYMVDIIFDYFGW